MVSQSVGMMDHAKVDMTAVDSVSQTGDEKAGSLELAVVEQLVDQKVCQRVVVMVGKMEYWSVVEMDLLTVVAMDDSVVVEMAPWRVLLQVVEMVCVMVYQKVVEMVQSMGFEQVDLKVVAMVCEEAVLLVAMKDKQTVSVKVF